MALDPAIRTGLAGRIFRPGTPQALALLRAAWPVVVGPEVARRTEAQALAGRTLHVRVPDAAWRKTLHRMRRDILARLRDVAGDVAPDALGFVEGPVAGGKAPAPPAAAPAPVPPAPAALRAGAEAIPDPELRARFLETAARYLARASRRAAAEGGP